MQRVLVAYTTNAGSTEEVAQAVAEELRRGGLAQVDVLPAAQVTSLDPYQAVVVGAPMIFGWHRAAARFVKRHRAALAGRPVAYFCTLLRLTGQPGSRPPEAAGLPAALFVDPNLPTPPERAGRLSLKERYASLPNYLRPVLAAAPGVRPVSVAFFAGKLELFRLKWWQALFVIAVIRAAPGDRRNWPCIQAWAADLRPKLLA